MFNLKEGNTEKSPEKKFSLSREDLAKNFTAYIGKKVMITKKEGYEEISKVVGIITEIFPNENTIVVSSETTGKERIKQKIVIDDKTRIIIFHP